MTDLPYYIDDPLVDTKAHQLTMHIDGAALSQGFVAMFGECACGEWTSPTYDRNGVFEAYDIHMSQVQATAHQQAGETPR